MGLIKEELGSHCLSHTDRIREHYGESYDICLATKMNPLSPVYVPDDPERDSVLDGFGSRSTPVFLNEMSADSMDIREFPHPFLNGGLPLQNPYESGFTFGFGMVEHTFVTRNPKLPNKDFELKGVRFKVHGDPRDEGFL